MKFPGSTHLLVGVIGSRADAEKVKNDIKEFLGTRLKLELSDVKTLVTHAGDKARFLGYDVTTAKLSAQTITRINGLIICWKKAFFKSKKMKVAKNAGCQ